MYVKIPVSIAYFLLGCVSTLAILIVISVIIVNKEKKKKKELSESILKSLMNNDKSDDE